MSENVIGWKPKSYEFNLASSRLRCLNPLIELQRRNYPIELFNGNRKYSAVIYSKRYDDIDYTEAKKLQDLGTHIIFDLCDNHFYNPNNLTEWHNNADKLRRMLNLVDTIVTSTHTLAKIINNNLDEPRVIHVIGEAVETSEVNTPSKESHEQVESLSHFLVQLEKEKKTGVTHIVWCGHWGSPNYGGGISELKRIQKILENINKQYPISLTVISNSYEIYKKCVEPWSLKTRYFTWSREVGARLLNAHAISVIPFEKNPATICKSNNRLLLNLYNGIAVVADSIPSYMPFSNCCILDNWEDGLKQYICGPELRTKHTSEAKRIINKTWNIEYIATQWQNLFDFCLKSSGLIAR